MQSPRKLFFNNYSILEKTNWTRSFIPILTATLNTEQFSKCCRCFNKGTACFGDIAIYHCCPQPGHQLLQWLGSRPCPACRPPQLSSAGWPRLWTGHWRLPQPSAAPQRCPGARCSRRGAEGSTGSCLQRSHQPCTGEEQLGLLGAAVTAPAPRAASWSCSGTFHGNCWIPTAILSLVLFIQAKLLCFWVFLLNRMWLQRCLLRLGKRSRE